MLTVVNIIGSEADPGRSIPVEQMDDERDEDEEVDAELDQHWKNLQKALAKIDSDEKEKKNGV